MSQISRNDGIDNLLSPNGPHPLYYVTEEDGTEHGPYSCTREAELAFRGEMAEIHDSHGNPVDAPTG